VASLARAFGPSLAAVLIASPIAHLGADGQSHYMSDYSLFATFWTGAAIMLVASLLAFYFSKIKENKSGRGQAERAPAV
jgi:hypothetical protein